MITMTAASGLGYRRLASIFGCSLFFSCSPGQREASCHVVSCSVDRYLCKDMREASSQSVRNWAGEEQWSSEKLEALSPATREELNLANNHMSGLRSASFSKQTFRCVLSPANSVTARSGKTFSQPHPNSWFQNKCFLSQAANFWGNLLYGNK